MKQNFTQFLTLGFSQMSRKNSEHLLSGTKAGNCNQSNVCSQKKVIVKAKTNISTLVKMLLVLCLTGMSFKPVFAATGRIGMSATMCKGTSVVFPLNNLAKAGNSNYPAPFFALSLYLHNGALYLLVPAADPIYSLVDTDGNGTADALRVQMNNASSFTGNVMLRINTGDGNNNAVVFDLLLTVVDCTAMNSGLNLDYGDAPDIPGGASTGAGNYNTLDADNGPRHLFNNELYLGNSAPDADPGTLQSVAAQEDDISNTGSTDDEDGVSVFPVISTTSTSVSFTVSVFNNTGADATLACWFDFNRDGDFLDAGEITSVTVPPSALQQTASVTFTGFTTPVAGISYLRCRIAVNSSEVSAPTGLASTGEVEDVAVNILANISGYVYNDANGLTDLTVNGTGTNVGGSIYAHLFSTGIEIAKFDVLANGKYEFLNLTAGAYTVLINNSPSPSSGTTLPQGWINTGENIGVSEGNDLTVNGTVNPVIITTADITDVNFGIEKLPESITQSYTISQPAAGALISLNGSGSTGSPGPLTGNDFEDLYTTAFLIGKTVQITTVPSNADLLYDGIKLSNGDIISNYNPALLSVKLTSATVGALSTSFTYAYRDAAGAVDNTPATYTINWAIALPVTLKLFTVQVNSDCSAIMLKWSTAAEQNSKQFLVERSSNGRDWKVIGNVAASGNSSSEMNYQYADASVTAGNYLYRLRMVDVDMQEKISEIVSVNFNCFKVQYSVYPVPVRDMLTVELKGKGLKQLLIYNSMGQIIKSETVNGASVLQINTNNWSNGIYEAAIIQDNRKIYTKRIIKQ